MIFYWQIERPQKNRLQSIAYDDVGGSFKMLMAE